MPDTGDDWTLLVGPGGRLASLHPLLTGAARSVRMIVDLDELIEPRSGAGTLLVDADVLPAEDLGFLRRFLAREEGWQVTLVGEDSSRRVARTLLRMPRVRWMSWPPDLEDLRELVAPALAMSTAAAALAGARPRAPSAPRAVDRELESIESILEEPQEGPAPGPPSGSAPTAAAARTPATAANPSAAPATGTATAAPGAGPARPPRYFKDQVADLADLAQRLEAGLTALGPGRNPAGEALSGDVARLVQFARTLGYVAVAPPQGDQVFDLAELLDLLVSGIVRKSPDAPRWLHRAEGALPVRSDRELLTQALDALLVLADRSASAGQLVRVAARAEDGAARVRIEFPAGPLKDLEPPAILEPYALRRILPDFGPNALAAASGILAGQGGRLSLGRQGRGRLEWAIEIPLHVPGPGAAGAPTAARRSTASAADPFA